MQAIIGGTFSGSKKAAQIYLYWGDHEISKHIKDTSEIGFRLTKNTKKEKASLAHFLKGASVNGIATFVVSSSTANEALLGIISLCEIEKRISLKKEMCPIDTISGITILVPRVDLERFVSIVRGVLPCL